jgi:hypothetical protein
MTLRLPILPRGISLMEAGGIPNSRFQAWWQSVVSAIETQEALQDAAIVAIQTLQSEQAALLEELEAQLLLIQAAQNTANAVTVANAISASWISPAAVLSAVDAGTDATITVAGFTRFYDDGTSLAVTGDSLTGLAYATMYAVYYDDPTRGDTTPTFVATTFGGEARHNFAVGRHFVGTITTPAAGMPDTGGDPYVPPGGGPDVSIP